MKDENITPETVTQKDFDDAVLIMNCYYRKVTRKTECIKFYIDYIQPIIMLIESIEEQEEKDF